MTALQVVETGEVIEAMTRVEAERITSRIADKLDSIADNLQQVLPLISEALTRDAWKALGYTSPTAYVSERFAGALSRLPREIRTPVVCELSAAGMSTRAIAPIVGVTQKTVVKDTQVIPEVSPAPSPEVDQDEWASPTAILNNAAGPEPTPEPDKVTGMDGKQYPRSTPPEPRKQRRRPITDAFWDTRRDLQKRAETLHRLTEDDRWAQNAEKVAETNLGDLLRTRDLLEQVIQQLQFN